ncbi:MAG TPA: hypothetical protein VJX67_25055, partial [Blastocatellia bacterium]|nr:hypothetical protein [Blastocatellia bacterium]
MAAYHFPVLVWKDFEGYYTACLAENPFNIASTAPSRKQALAEVKEYLAWSYADKPYQAEPDFLDPKLTMFRTEVRAEYVIEKRLYPADHPMVLKVAAVHGHQKDGLLVCSLPMLRTRFYYYDNKSLKDLVRAYVQEGLKGSTQAELSRFLMPEEVSLDEIVVQVRGKPQDLAYRPDIALLTSVAEPLGAKSFRRRLSHAWERSSEVADLVRKLAAERASVILVGEPSVGKTAVLATAVRQIEREEAEAQTAGLSSRGDNEALGATTTPHRFWLTSGPRLIAGAQYLGQWEERVESVIDQLSEIN